MRALFRYLNQPDFPARYNIAPTQPVPIVRIFEGRREFALVRCCSTRAANRPPRSRPSATP